MKLLPNDIPEVIDGVAGPDHGKLWSPSLAPEVAGDSSVPLFRVPAVHV